MLQILIAVLRDLGYQRLLISQEIFQQNILAVNAISNFVHKINQSVGGRVARMKTEFMFK